MVAEQSAETHPRRDLLDAIWRIASGKTTRLVLLALLMLSIVLGTLLPQLPATAASDPAMTSRWLSTTLPRYGPWGPLLRSVKLFDIAHALWFRLLLALIALHLLLRAVEMAQTAWATLSRRPPPPPAHLPRMSSLSLLPPLPEAVSLVRSQLAAHGFQVLPQMEEKATGAHLYADRARIGILSPLLSDIGGLLLLAALLINSTLGWQMSDLLLAPGQEIRLGHNTGLSLRLERAPSTGGAGRLLFLDASGEVAAQPLTFAHPARHAGISAHQTGDGPALMVRGEDKAGRPVLLQPLVAKGAAANTVSLIFDQPQAERHLTVPERNLALRLVAQPAGNRDDQPAFWLQAYQGGHTEPILDTVIGANSVLEVAGTRFEFRPERYVVLQVVHAPGFGLLLAGGALLLLGAILPLIWPTLQVWVELIPERRAISVRLLGWGQGASMAVGEELALLAGATKGEGEDGT